MHELKTNQVKITLKRSLLIVALLLPAFAVAQQRHDPLLIQSLQDNLRHADSFTDRFEAEVWLLVMSQRMQPFIKDPGQRIQLLQSVHREASRTNLPAELVLALIHTESSFDRFAVSSAGAQGLMQVMPFWKSVIGRPDDNLTDIETNLRYGSAILSHYLERESGNLTRALARYNGSPGQTWYPERVYKNWNRHWKND
ncbi:lytic transglycosylase domain-containing protein [Endozoicomonas lisbonensis]|uniref:Soluble lytic murein transglycosylase-like protein n=1 Tax=Endozoicomonas lisbonensis TaxID=3120522 RepID=A0ABV2SLK2_9GAMM